MKINLNDLDFIVESGDGSGECSYSTKPHKLCRKSSAKSAVSESPKRPISSVPGNLEELNINDCKLYMGVKIRYEEETYFGKIVEIEKHVLGVSKCHLALLWTLSTKWRMNEVVAFSQLFIRVMLNL